MDDMYESRHTGAEIDDAIDRAKAGGEIDAILNAAEYSSAQTYALGDYCTHDGKLYRCTTAITEAEAWTDIHWTETSVTDELKAIYMTLQNKPSKSPVHVDDANDVTKSGFYTCKTNIPFGYGLANVLAVGDIDDTNNIFTQIAFGVNLNPTNRNAIAVRCYVPGEGFKDWEWFNPPMILGVEYRTTERYQGKPVYVMTKDYGLVQEKNTAKTASIPENAGHGWVINGLVTHYGIPIPSWNDDGSLKFGAQYDYGARQIRFIANEGRVNPNAKYVLTIKYVKTTD